MTYTQRCAPFSCFINTYQYHRKKKSDIHPSSPTELKQINKAGAPHCTHLIGKTEFSQRRMFDEAEGRGKPMANAQLRPGSDFNSLLWVYHEKISCFTALYIYIYLSIF